MFITMIGDGTAFASLVFGYFFFWTIHADFTAGHAGPGMALADGRAGAVRRRLGRDARRAPAERARLDRRHARWRSSPPSSLTLAASPPAFAGPWHTPCDPTAHVYPAIVWMLVIWVLAHAARRRRHAALLPGAQPRRPADAGARHRLRNVALYWHFMALTAVITFAVIGLFPGAM